MQIRSPLTLPTALALLAVLAIAPAGAGDYPPIGNVQGEFINYETPLVAPILVTSDGQHVVAINEPDGRVVVRQTQGGGAIVAEIPAGQGLIALAERPGGEEIWVSAMHSAAVMVIETKNWRVTHALRPPLGEGLKLLDAAAPAGIAFSADGARAFVVASATDAVNVYDAAGKSHLATVPLEVTHNGRVTRVKEPRAITRAGDSIFVAVFRSGNNTAAVPHEEFGISPVILDLDDFANLSLPDADLIELSAADGSVIGHQKGVGNLMYGLRTHPESGDLLVTHMDGRNADFLGEGAFPQGRMTLNKLSYVTPGQAPADYTRVALEDLDAGDGIFHVAMPTDIAVDGQGRVYVAGYASAVIAVFDTAGALVGELPTDLGPRGLAVTPSGDVLYALNRIDGTITAYDVSGDLPSAPMNTLPIGSHDPTYEHVAEGRALYNDAVLGSGGDSTGCFSCHPDLTQDGLGWELSAYHDVGSGFTPENPPRFWKDRKFVRTTQDSRSLQGSAPYHWRGEQHDLEGFNNAFVGLQHSDKLSDEDFAKLKAFTMATFYPANPFQRFDRELTRQAELGWRVITEKEACQDCHTLPMGTRGSVTATVVIGQHVAGGATLRSTEPGSWLGLWTKDASPANLNASGPQLLSAVTGFGFDHSGSHYNLQHFISRTGERNQPPDERPDLSHGGQVEMDDAANIASFHFVHELDTGIPPSANFAEMLDQSTEPTFPANVLLAQADAGNNDLIATGHLDAGSGLQQVGLLYDPGAGVFLADDSELGTFSMTELRDLARVGEASLLFQGVPVWSGSRLGVDQDRDGLFNGDELRLGTLPGDPDTDGDGFWDSYDDDPLVPNDSVTSTAPPVISDVEVVYVNTRTALVRYRTDTFSPTHVVYGLTTDYDQSVGDPLPLPEGSNRWKRTHAITLRNLEEGALYHFQVRALAQNGEIAASSDFTVETLAKKINTLPHTDQSIHVVDLGLEVTGTSPTTVTATVTVNSNLREVVPDATISGVWTIFRNGQPQLQIPAEQATTDAAGVAVVELTNSQLRSGDTVDFFIPMYRGELGSEIVGVLDNPVERRPFSWSDNEISGAAVDIP